MLLHPPHFQSFVEHDQASLAHLFELVDFKYPALRNAE